MKGIRYDITPILGSSAGYREKRSHDRFTQDQARNQGGNLPPRNFQNIT